MRGWGSQIFESGIIPAEMNTSTPSIWPLTSILSSWPNFITIIFSINVFLSFYGLCAVKIKLKFKTYCSRHLVWPFAFFDSYGSRTILSKLWFWKITYSFLSLIWNFYFKGTIIWNEYYKEKECFQWKSSKFHFHISIFQFEIS